MNSFSQNQAAYFNELEDRDELFKIYYSEQLRKRLQIKKDCEAISYRQISDRLCFYQKKRQFWPADGDKRNVVLTSESAPYNAVFLTDEQLEQANRQQRFDEIQQQAARESEYKPSTHKAAVFKPGPLGKSVHLNRLWRSK